MKHLPYLDGWRGLAIACVLQAHFLRVPSVDTGRLGVDLFFVLSGLLMARILFVERMPLREFYRRRISRIIPAYFLFLAVILTIWHSQVTLSEVLSLVTFTRTYVGGFIFLDPIPIQHIWSLNVEEHCYVLMAMIAAIGALRRSAATVLLALGLSTFGFIALHAHYSADPLKSYMLNTECAATYLLLAAGYRLLPKPQVPEWTVWIALGIGIACFTRLPLPAKGILLPPFLLAFAVNHLEDAPTLRRILSVRWLCWLGLVSYSVYLWQQPLFHALPNVWGILVAIALGSASFYLYENPIRQFLNRRASKKTENRIAKDSEDSLSNSRQIAEPRDNTTG